VPPKKDEENHLKGLRPFHVKLDLKARNALAKGKRLTGASVGELIRRAVVKAYGEIHEVPKWYSEGEK